MIPVLYDKTGANKIGDLIDSIECYIEEERNGIFELTMVYPANTTLLDNLCYENIIVADANDYLKQQKFRIYNTRKLMSNRIEICARHISFDLAHDWIDALSINNQSCEYVLNTIFKKSQFSSHFKGYSDIINAQDYAINETTCLNAIGGSEGSILDTFGTGAEILRDNTDIHVLNRRGSDNDVSIEYRKNLTGLEVEEDTTDLVTRILPYATYTNDNSEEIKIKGAFVDSPLINSYAHPYVKYIDYSSEFDEDNLPTTSKLKALANKEYINNKVDIPKMNYKIEFIPLSKCAGYEGLEDKINLCDTVTIRDTRYGIDTQSKVIKVTYDALRDRYESMELGEPRTTLGDIIGGTGESTQGPPGPQGPQGPAGADGSIGDFPSTLPEVPTITTKVYGFANIEVSWTFENKVYYSYELYASKTKGFVPNTFNLIFEGQASTFLHQVNPDETWYYRACAINSHGLRTEFSDEVEVSTVKITDLSNYVENLSIGDALIGELNLGRGWVGELRGNYIDAKQLSVTDGNGKRTFDIDSFGNVNLDVASLKIQSQTAATIKDVTSKIEQTSSGILTTVSETYYNKNEVDGKGFQTKSQVQQTLDTFEIKFTESGGYNRVYNGCFKNGLNDWNVYGTPSTQIKKYENGYDSTLLLTTTGNNQYIYQYFDNLQVGKTYTVSAYVHGKAGAFGLQIQHNNTKKRAEAKETNVWHTLSVTFVAVVNTLQVQLGRGNFGSDGSHMFTAVQLEEGSVPSPYSPNPSEMYDGIITFDKDGLNVDCSNVDTQSKVNADGFKIFRKSDNKKLFDASNGNLTMEGVLATGATGKYIKVSDSNYKVFNNTTQTAFFGLASNDVWTDSPKLILGISGTVQSSNNSPFSISHYKPNENPQAINAFYTDFSQYTPANNDYSNIKLYSDGVIRLAPLKELEITSNYSNGDYNGTGENLIAKFSTSSTEYFNGYLQVGAILNRTNNNGLILEHYKDSIRCAVRVNVDSNNEQFFRPVQNTGVISCGSTGYPWKSVVSKNTLSSQGVVVSEMNTLNLEDVNANNALDHINFVEPTSDETDTELLMDVTALQNTNFVELSEDKQKAYMNDSEMIKLLLLEVKKLKEEVRQLKVDSN